MRDDRLSGAFLGGSMRPTAEYFLSFAAAAASAVLLTPVSMKIARLMGAVDKPNARKVHFRPTPRAGGIAIYAAVAVVVVPALLSMGQRGEVAGLDRLWIVLTALSTIFLLGLFDDVVNLHRAQFKLLALSGASFAVCAAGFSLKQVSVGQHYTVQLGMFAWPISFLWIVGVTTSINFIDGLDGLAAGVSAIAAGSIALVAAVGHDTATAVMAFALAGSLVGFLLWNTNPARVFMGDCGSMFLGFALSTLSLVCANRTRMTAGFALPALALGIPIMDTALTMIRRRVLQRRSLFAAERGHVHHRLIDLGFRHRNAVMILYAVTSAGAAFGVAAFFCTSQAAEIAFAAIPPLILGFFFASVGSLRVGDIAAAFRRNRDISKLTRRYGDTFDEMQLRFQAARSFDAWWREVTEALRRLDCVRLTLSLSNRDGESRSLTWEREPVSSTRQTLHVRIPVRDRRGMIPLRADVEVNADDSLELAGRRVTILGRLLEENGLRSLKDVRPNADRRSKISFGGPSIVPRLNSRIGEEVKIAVVHDFLYTYAGAERVLEQILNVFPHADLFSLFDFLPEEKRAFLQDKPVTTSFIQRMPFARSRHRHYLALMPLAIEQLDVSKYDIVISSSYVAAKGILTRPDQLHVCYCHSPVRFAWDLQHQYLHETGLSTGVKSVLARAILHYIRNWDTRSANGVDKFLSNSDFVGRRIEKFYRRRSTTLYPPVDVDRFSLQIEKEDYYLTASRMVPYKRMDLIAEAFSAMPEKRLIIVGDGPDLDKVRAKCGPNIKLVGHQPFDRLADYMRHARAFVFAAEEDFGIVSVEAQACGTPVIAYGRGGATETVSDGRTGILFPEQTVESLCEAVCRFEENRDAFDPVVIRAHAEQYNAGRFRDEFLRLVEDEWIAFGNASGRKASDNAFVNPNVAWQAIKLRERVTALEATDSKVI
jgi:UDP-N-acetylmuramyl pentapeptide phosphotransferase/UDP-N-acetylglucosamine-1-phosphate transferase/glycosyltransferase involved in cell wall biosynthesis